EPAEEEPGDGEPALRAVTVGELAVRDARVALALGAEDEEEPGPTRAEVALDAEAADLAWEHGAPLRLPATLDARATLAPSTIAGRAVERGALVLRMAGTRVEVPEAELAGPFGTIAVTDAA